MKTIKKSWTEEERQTSIPVRFISDVKIRGNFDPHRFPLKKRTVILYLLLLYTLKVKYKTEFLFLVWKGIEGRKKIDHTPVHP